MEERRVSRLLARIADGDEEATRDLFVLAEGPLMRFFYRLTRCAETSEDLVQTTLMRLWTHRSTYAATGRAKGYLYRVALNEWRRGHASRRRDLEAHETWKHDQTERYEHPPSRVVESTEGCRRIMTALASLPDDQRDVVVLHRFEGLSCREIGEVCGLSRKTVESRLRLALEKLTYKLGRAEGRA